MRKEALEKKGKRGRVVRGSEVRDTGIKQEKERRGALRGKGDKGDSIRQPREKGKVGKEGEKRRGEKYS